MATVRHNIKDVPTYLRETRERLGMSQSNFAQAMGVTAQTVYFWETMKRKPPPLALEWCVTLRTALDYAKEEQLDPSIEWGAILQAGGLGALVGGLLVGLDKIGLGGLLKK